jgi:hypothetical protein
MPVIKSRERRTSQDRPIAAREKAAIRSGAERAKDSLGLKRIRDPRKLAAAVHKSIDASRTANLKNEVKESLASDLAMLWGEALVAAGAWEWRRIDVDDENILGLCNHNRTFMVDPIAVMQRLLSSRRVPNNCELLFNMILDADSLPKGAEFSYVPLS